MTETARGVEVVDAEWGIHPYPDGNSWLVDNTGGLRIYLGGIDVPVRKDNCVAEWAPRSWRAVYSANAERLPDPEPEWQVGDVVKSASGAEWKRAHDNQWYGWGISKPVDDGMLMRPLTLLVRDGKPVTGG